MTEQTMTGVKATAEQFFDACETGKGWETCKAYCHSDATFSAQAAALAEVTTLQAYTDWMKGIFMLMPDAGYELRACAVDEDRHSVTMYGVFSGTHTGEGGPVPPTGKHVDSDYVYVIAFEGDRIRHLTKIWNDGFAFKQAGWA